MDGSSWTVGRAVDCTRLESEKPYRFRGSNPLPSAESAWLDCPVTSIRDLFGLNYTDSPFSLRLSSDSVTQLVECHLDSMEAAGSSPAGITPHT